MSLGDFTHGEMMLSAGQRYFVNTFMYRFRQILVTLGSLVIFWLEWTSLNQRDWDFAGAVLLILSALVLIDIVERPVSRSWREYRRWCR